MKTRIVVTALVVLLAGCGTAVHGGPRTPTTRQIVDIGFTHESVSGYCFDCDMRQRGVPGEDLEEWHAAVAGALTCPILEITDPAEWALYVDRATSALAKRFDFRSILRSRDEGPRIVRLAIDNVHACVQRARNGGRCR